MLDRGQIEHGASERRKQTVSSVEVPEWGGEVGIRRMSAADLKETGFWDTNGSGDAAFADVIPRVLAGCICDSSGNRLFSYEENDLKVLADIDFEMQMRLFDAFARANHLADADREEAAEAFGEARGDDDSTA